MARRNRSRLWQLLRASQFPSIPPGGRRNRVRAPVRAVGQCAGAGGVILPFPAVVICLFSLVLSVFDRNQSNCDILPPSQEATCNVELRFSQSSFSRHLRSGNNPVPPRRLVRITDTRPSRQSRQTRSGRTLGRATSASWLAN